MPGEAGGIGKRTCGIGLRRARSREVFTDRRLKVLALGRGFARLEARFFLLVFFIRAGSDRCRECDT